MIDVTLKGNDVIDLDRKYVPVSLSQEDLETHALKSQLALLSGETFGLTIYDLLKKPLTVVLGEARSGKTTEFKVATQKLNKEGRYAFFLQLEDLKGLNSRSPDAILDALEVEAEDKFKKWLATNQEAIFFLDAVDEAKLQNPNDYKRAIRTFHKLLKPHLNRCRVVVSCRVTEWRPRTDNAPLERLCYALKRESEEESDARGAQEIQIVQLCPLNETQIEKIAHFRGLNRTETSKFIEELKSAGAVDFAGRPGDAIELADLWKREHRLGTLTEITEQDVCRKLQEESEVYEARLSIEKTRLGAERLAAAATLCGQSAFRFTPHEEDIRDSLPALDPYKLLPDWTKEDIKALLRRPIFDEATYGRVRFHTRTVREYLTASWLKKRHEKGCPAKEIVDIFFATRYGKTVIRRKFSSIAAWLAPPFPELLDELCRHNPEVLPDEGDPQTLPLDVKKKILKAFVERYSDRTYTSFWYDFQKLRRFAEPGLADCIKGLLQGPSTTTGAKRLLLNLVETGKIPGCNEELVSIALNEEEDSDIRVSAFLALKIYEAQKELGQIYHYLKATSNIPKDIYACSLYALYPVAIGPGKLLELIEAIPKRQFSGTSSFKKRINAILEKETDRERLKILLPGLWQFIKDSQANQDQSLDENSYSWLIEALGQGLCNWFKIRGGNFEELFDILDFFEEKYAFEHQERDLVGGIRTAFTQESPTLRKAYFKHRFDIFVQKEKRDEIYCFQFLNHHGILELAYHDSKWLIEDAISTEDAKYRFTAFDAAIRVCISEKDKCDPRERVNSVIQKYHELKGHLEKMLNPPVSQYELASRLRKKIKKLKERWRVISFQQHILPYISEIASGTDERRLIATFHYLQRITRERIPSNLNTLIPLLGEKGVSAFRSGLIKFLEIWEPDDPRRLGEEMALLGVGLAIEEGLSFETLDESQILKLTKLALKEFEFPEWFSKLFKEHPTIVAAYIKPLILRELDESEAHTSNNEKRHPSLFASIVHELPEAVDLINKDLFEWAKSNMPLSENTRLHIVRAFSHEPCRDFLASLATSYFRPKAQLHVDDVFWLALWLQVDAIKALDWLEATLKKIEPRQADDAILHLANTLYHHHGEGTGFQGPPDYYTVPALTRLIKIVFDHIRFEDDPEREGTWTPDMRDHAEGFRNELIEKLARIPGKDSFNALLKIRENTARKGVKDWLLRTIEEKIDRETPLIWSEQEVLDFETDHEHEPKTIDDLFVIALKRLAEIKNKMETGDYSLRELFSDSTSEDLLQKFMAERLKELSRDRYSVERESEVDNQKKSDIRLLRLNLPPVSIEIKWAHKWSLTKLESALRVQLVEKYLRAVDSTHGVFLLVNAKPGRTWKLESRKLDFKALLNHLDAIAHELESQEAGVERLEVVGIDFTSEGKGS